MKSKQRRQIIARWLLAVFLPMLVFSSLHIHSGQSTVADECTKCMTHQSHDGHFRTAHVTMHDCVLCQMLSLPIVVAAVAVLTLYLQVLYAFRYDSEQMLVTWPKGFHPLRAPPFV